MSKKGFTLMELTIVLALLAILAAILIPLFLRTTDRARLRSDIQSARVIQNAMDLYRLEGGQHVAGDNMSQRIARLVETYYISPRNTDPQTVGAEWVLYGGVVRVCIRGVNDDSVHAVAQNLSDEEQDMLVNVQSAR